MRNYWAKCAYHTRVNTARESSAGHLNARLRAPNRIHDQWGGQHSQYAVHVAQTPCNCQRRNDKHETDLGVVEDEFELVVREDVRVRVDVLEREVDGGQHAAPQPPLPAAAAAARRLHPAPAHGEQPRDVDLLLPVARLASAVVGL